MTNIDAVAIKLINVYLVYKTRFLSFYYYWRNKCITNTDGISGIDSKGNKTNLIYKYYVIFMINYLIKFLTFIKSTLDKPYKMIELIKNNNNCIVTTIHTNYLSPDSTVYIDDVCKRLNRIDTVFEKKVNKRIFSQCKLELEPETNTIEQICLKSYMTKYRDDLGTHDHNLSNIVKLNHPDVNLANASINLVYYEDGKKKSSKILYEECHQEHINYLYNIDL